MAYEIKFLPSAARELAALPREAQRRIARRFEGLKEEPRPAGVKAIRASEGILRIRVGDYRLLYRVADEVLEVLVVKVGHRREVYRRAHSPRIREN